MTHILETARLTLRRMTTNDAPFVIELLNEPSYHQNIGDRGIRTLADAGKYITEQFIGSYEKYGFGLYLVKLKNSSTPIGIAGLIKRDSLKNVDIGFAFLSQHHQKGFAVESALGILDYAKNMIGLERVVGITVPHNVASIKVLERIGMKFERNITLPEIGHEDKFFSLDFETN